MRLQASKSRTAATSYPTLADYVMTRRQFFKNLSTKVAMFVATGAFSGGCSRHQRRRSLPKDSFYHPEVSRKTRLQGLGPWGRSPGVSVSEVYQAAKGYFEACIAKCVNNSKFRQ